MTLWTPDSGAFRVGRIPQDKATPITKFLRVIRGRIYGDKTFPAGSFRGAVIAVGLSTDFPSGEASIGCK